MLLAIRHGPALSDRSTAVTHYAARLAAVTGVDVFVAAETLTVAQDAADAPISSVSSFGPCSLHA